VEQTVLYHTIIIIVIIIDSSLNRLLSLIVQRVNSNITTIISASLLRKVQLMLSTPCAPT